MASVLIAAADVGIAMELEEQLEAAGYAVTWDANSTGGDGGGHDVVVVTTTGTGDIESMLTAARPPLVVVIGRSSEADEYAGRGVTFLPAEHTSDRVSAIAAAMPNRFAARLAPNFVCAALSITADFTGAELATKVASLSRGVDVGLVKLALSRYANHYAAIARPDVIATLRELRALHIPEVEYLAKLTGATTLRTAIAAGPLDGAAAGRMLWAYTCLGITSLTAEPPDVSTPERRRVFELRQHLRARHARLANSTFFDVLEVDPTAPVEHIEAAFRAAHIRYNPTSLAELDLGDVAELVQPLYDELTRARATLYYDASSKQYEFHLRGQPSYQTAWYKQIDTGAAEAAFARGQQALVSGDVFRAVSNLAAAARAQPDHPVYESALIWAQYRAHVAKEGDDRDRAKDGVRKAELAQRGYRPWPRALVALALLCIAAGDSDAARYHLREALTVNPNQPAAQQMLQRLR